MTFYLNLVACDSDDLAVPSNRPSAQAQIPAMTFAKLCREMSYISEMATFSLAKVEEELKIAILSEVSNGSIKFHTVKGEAKESTTLVRVSKELKQAFSLRYLNHFNRAAHL